jgi:Flp pilus assembly protein TadD
MPSLARCRLGASIVLVFAGCVPAAPVAPSAAERERANPHPGSSPARTEPRASPPSSQPDPGAGPRVPLVSPEGPRPSDEEAIRRLTPFETELARAQAALAAGDPSTAERIYTSLRSGAPTDPAPRLGLLEVRWTRLGLPLVYAEAPANPELRRLVTEADALLGEHADYAPALLDKGRWLVVLGEADAARIPLERAAALDAQNAEVHSALGTAYLASGEPERALAEFQSAVQLGPEDPERLTNLGTALMLRGRLTEAIASFEHSLSSRPDDARTQGDLGAAQLANGRADLALSHLLRATQLEPKRATFLTNLGYAFECQGELDKAIETQRKAVALDPKLGSAWINLGNALAERHKYEQAEVALRQAAALDPSDPRPAASLKDLEELRARESSPPATPTPP